MIQPIERRAWQLHAHQPTEMLRRTNTLISLNISDPASPVQAWSFVGDGQLITPPLLIDTGVRMIVIEGSASGTLYALDAPTGNVLWSGDVGAPILQSNESQQLAVPLGGLSAGHGLLAVPALNSLIVLGGTPAQQVAAPQLSFFSLTILVIGTLIVGTLFLFRFVAHR